MHSNSLYAAKCYWPGATNGQLRRAAGRAGAACTGSAIAYLGSIVFPDDELVLCLFDAPSRAVVRATAERAGMPCERVMYWCWLPWAGAPTTMGEGGRPPRPAHWS
jgi:Protein of unknown function (DUF4242)